MGHQPLRSGILDGMDHEVERKIQSEGCPNRLARCVGRIEVVCHSCRMKLFLSLMWEAHP